MQRVLVIIQRRISTFLMHKQVNMPFCMQQQNAIIFQMRCFHRALFSQQNYMRVHFLNIFPRLPFIQHKLFDIDHSIHLSSFYPSFKSEWRSNTHNLIWPSFLCLFYIISTYRSLPVFPFIFHFLSPSNSENSVLARVNFWHDVTLKIYRNFQENKVEIHQNRTPSNKHNILIYLFCLLYTRALSILWGILEWFCFKRSCLKLRCTQKG